jgi:hypothetical protein
MRKRRKLFSTQKARFYLLFLGGSENLEFNISVVLAAGHLGPVDFALGLPVAGRDGGAVFSELKSPHVTFPGDGSVWAALAYKKCNGVALLVCDEGKVIACEDIIYPAVWFVDLAQFGFQLWT